MNLELGLQTSLTLFYLVLLLDFNIFFLPVTASLCPCLKESYCEVIATKPKHEVYAFSVSTDPAVWLKYDWNKTTTVAVFSKISSDLLCHAHKHGVRVVTTRNYPIKDLLDDNKQKAWIQFALDYVTSNHLDGLNIDFESAIPTFQCEQRRAFTALVTETYHAFKENNSLFQVTVDVAWSPNCIDDRCYDYKALSNVTDFLFVMSYDEQSQIYGPCVAGANSGYYRTTKGLQDYINLGIPSRKLILGIPWYGYGYHCLILNMDKSCTIQAKPFHGAPCSDAAGWQVGFGNLMDIIHKEHSSVMWNASTLTPYFIVYNSSGHSYTQYQFDNRQSLRLKYGLLTFMNLGGVGMWNADLLDNSNTPAALEQRTLMWTDLP